MSAGYIKKLFIVAVLITVGILLEVFGFFDAENVFNIVRDYADKWWLVLILILLQVILFTFALAGSVFLWIVAPLYPPAIATFILVTGSTVGGMTAYIFSKYLTEEWIAKIENSRTYKLLHEQDNFFVLFALRVFPAFPQSLINYSSGILSVKLTHFILAAVLGVSIKSYIYSNVIYNTASSESYEELLDISTYGPLILLSAIMLLVVFIRHKVTGTGK